MHGEEILLWGIGIQGPWQMVDQHLDASAQPHELFLVGPSERVGRAEE